MNETESIGIPYAFEISRDGERYKECPVCKELIGPLRHRKDFESFSGREYQEHYRDQHE